MIPHGIIPFGIIYKNTKKLEDYSHAINLKIFSESLYFLGFHNEVNESNGKTGVSDHHLAIFVGHNIFLTINKGNGQVAPAKTCQSERFFQLYHSKLS